MHIWLSLIDSKMEVGTKIRKAASYSANTGHLGPVVIGVFVWLLELLLEIVVWLPTSLTYRQRDDFLTWLL